MRQKISLMYIDSGGGRRAAATALAEVIRKQHRPWDLQLARGPHCCFPRWRDSPLRKRPRPKD